LALGVECHTCVNGISSPTRDFAGPAVLVGRWGCHGRDSGDILVESQGKGPPPKKAHLRSILQVSSMPAKAELGADDVPLGAVSIEANGAGRPSGDNVVSPRCYLVLQGVDSGTPGQTYQGGMVLAPEYSGVVGPGVAGLLLSGYPGSPFLPVNWRQVESSVEQVCL
jgi:hypothetical protein